MGKTDAMIFIPRELVQGEMDIITKLETLMAFCWIRRFGSLDGYYYGNILSITKKYGLSYDETKTSRIPKQISAFIEGLDNLQKIGAIVLEEGDYHNIHDFFTIKSTLEPFEKKYISLKFDYFDYIFTVKKRVNKMGMLYILVFVLGCYVCKEKPNGEKEWYRACSYSLDGLEYKTGIPRLSIYTYLKNLSVEEGYSGNAPLVKSRPWHITINGQVIRFPNIYVENLSNHKEIIETERKAIKVKFETQESRIEFDNFDDLDRYEFY